MNRKLVIGAVAGVAAVALAYGGSTYSAWSDFGNVEGNSVGAGVLKLELGPNQGDTLKFDNVKMAPGGIGAERHVYVASNAGDSTPSAQLFISLTNLVGHEDGCDGAEATVDSSCSDTSGPGQFIDDAVVQWSSYAVNSPGDCTQGYAPGDKVVTGQHGGSLKALFDAATPYELTGNGSASGGVDMSYLKPGEGLCVSMSVSLAYGVDNASQGDSADFDLRFDLKQAPYGTPVA